MSAKYCKTGHELNLENSYVAPGRSYISCRICERERSRNRRKEGSLSFKKSAKESKLKNRYGITSEEYDKQLLSQNSLCAICKKPETSTSNISKITLQLSVDHSHSTNKNRGLLCLRCNHAIGCFLDSPDICRAAALYLENPPMGN